MTTSPVMTVTDELIAELEKEAWLCDSDNTSMFMDPAVVADLLAERAELKRDAERYRWLRDNDDDLGYTFDAINEWLWSDQPFSTIDAAIDAAMQSSKRRQPRADDAAHMEVDTDAIANYKALP